MDRLDLSHQLHLSHPLARLHQLHQLDRFPLVHRLHQYQMPPQEFPVVQLDHQPLLDQ